MKRFTVVIYRHFMVIPSFCVIKHWYCSKYHRMAVNDPDKKFYNTAQGGKHKYRSNLPQYFNPRISRVKIILVIYCAIVL
jgi:hypothetical protein